MILEFSVENFKSINKKTIISFEATSDTTDEESHVVQIDKYRILKLCAMYGPNASGKTNILQALDFFRDFVVYSSTSIRPNEDTGFIPFLFNKKAWENYGTFSLSFFIDRIKYEYSITLDSKTIFSEHLFYSPKGQRKRIFEREYNSNIKRYTYLWGSSIKIDEKLVTKARKNIPFLSSIVQLIEHKEIKKIYDWFEYTLSTIISSRTKGLTFYTMDFIENNPEYKEEILSILSSSDLGNISDINIESFELDDKTVKKLPEEVKAKLKDEHGKYKIKNIFLEHQYKTGNGHIPLDMESHGTQRYFELAGPLGLSGKTAKCLLIDEIECSLHPELQEYFLASFLQNSKKESQLMFTTHNVQLMDSGLLRRDEIWFAEKNNETGGSEYFSLADIKGTRKEGSYRKQYLSGKYGALPVINTTTGRE